ncbi:CGNR zinc finger domain-containing protein [Solicola gregarius]|uniref:CGNR zinc finger domain-containing protein n=1 Tax=Solicola gregarius TaxID=2908642 RepID=A0AA46TK34_9ACTN|nr:CGNR zinc finger domain-containing protein [Solicola gregarius]UYM06730.1 CGNR zinc finger domain-containing protein [Solicola gregarius]
MDLVRYAERAADLVNADLEPTEAVDAYLADRRWLADQVTDKDARLLRRFQKELRPIFDQRARDAEVVDLLNSLLGKHPVTPYIAGDDADSWHLHVSNKASTVADLLVAEALMGLATLACDLGPGRFGECQASRCDAVFVDTSPNQSRRYCSERCSSRANVAAYRARQKALAREDAD